jgi:hypothetical protein
MYFYALKKRMYGTEDCEGVVLYSDTAVNKAQCNHCALTHTTYEVQRMVWFSTYHSQ